MLETPKEEVSTEFVRCWHNFNIPEIRDLAWLLFSPPLVNTYRGLATLQLVSDEQAATIWLKKLEHTRGSKLPKRSEFKRLGLYFEALIQHVLGLGRELSFLNYQLLAHHLQVNTHRDTLGEIDFIVENHRQQHTHLEAAVKFYLQDQPPPKPQTVSQANWLGPNAQDRLDIKFNRLFDKQLALSGHPRFAEQYPNCSAIHRRSHIFCGVLFHHWNDNANTPPALNPLCLRGHWVRHSEFATLLSAGNDHFVPLHKLEWLGGGQPPQTPIRAPAPQINQHRAQCFTRHAKNDQRELGRLMVVPDCWPQETQPEDKPAKS